MIFHLPSALNHISINIAAPKTPPKKNNPASILHPFPCWPFARSAGCSCGRPCGSRWITWCCWIPSCRHPNTRSWCGSGTLSPTQWCRWSSRPRVESRARARRTWGWWMEGRNHRESGGLVEKIDLRHPDTVSAWFFWQRWLWCDFPMWAFDLRWLRWTRS